MIGHLQTNKVGQVIDKVVLIHSCDSVHLAEKIEKEAAKRDMIANVLLEVNVAREESKFGMFLEDVIPNLKEIQAFPHVCVKGIFLFLLSGIPFFHFDQYGLFNFSHSASSFSSFCNKKRHQKNSYLFVSSNVLTYLLSLGRTAQKRFIRNVRI